jgi:hypothetical protein
MQLGFTPQDMELDARAMYRMLRHGNPILNGYASYYPTPFRQLKEVVSLDPVGLGLRYIQAYGTRYVLVHNHKLVSSEQKLLREALGSHIAYEDEGHAIYLLPDKKHPYDSAGLLPLTTKFDKVPQKDKAYRVPLPKKINEAVLILPENNRYIDFCWMDAMGKQKVKKARIRGSVILDSGDEFMYLRIISFPRSNKNADAVLVPKEDIL